MWKWLKIQFYHVLPAFLFFFCAFWLLRTTQRLMYTGEGLPPIKLITIVISAGIVAKVMLVIDNLPWIDPFTKKPAIYSVVWKTFIYSLSSLIVRVIDGILPFIKEKSFVVEYELFVHTVNWRFFWTIQMWYCILFLIFVVSREVVQAIGPRKMRRIFLG